MCRPWSTTSSPVLTTAVTSDGGTAATNPRRQRAAPTPPARAVITPAPYARACWRAMPRRVAIDATPLLGARTGVGTFVAGALPALADPDAGLDLDLRAYGLTWNGRRLLAPLVPPGVDTVAIPMAAGPL